MTINPKLNHKISIVIHSLGLSCLGGAIFLQILVFSNILMQGYFKAVENSPSILMLEVIITAFAATYFIFIYQKLIRSTFK